MTQRILPGAVIGVMGGGQLGRMFAMAARRMGYRVHIFTPEEDSPAGQFADRAVVADFGNEEAVRRFARELDVLTFEFENIPIETVNWCADHCTVRPAGSILHLAQNRLREKSALSHAQIPVGAYRPVHSAGELGRALEQIGRPAILKSAAFGYDGKGQERIAGAESAEKIWGTRSGGEFILERVIDFEKELSVIVARGPDGEIATFSVCENVHRNHILDVTSVAARIGEKVERRAAELARTIAEQNDLVGLLAVEMFLATEGELLVNELAPRPHNSGHWTIDGCATSQFEQQVRAVCGLPLGATDLLRPSAMANLLGDEWAQGEPNWASALRTPGVHLHLYGKKDARPGRKMGHLTALGATADGAVTKVLESRAALRRGRE